MLGSAVQGRTGLHLLGGLAQLARAPALQAGGQGFDSLILHYRNILLHFVGRQKFFDIIEDVR